MKELRDELAMSMPFESIGKLETFEAVQEMTEVLGFELDMENPVKALDWTFKYQAFVRYRYADAMLEERNKNKE